MYASCAVYILYDISMYVCMHRVLCIYYITYLCMYVCIVCCVYIILHIYVCMYASCAVYILYYISMYCAVYVYIIMCTVPSPLY